MVTVEEKKGISKNKKIQTMGIIFLVIIGFLAGAFLVISANWNQHNTIKKTLTHEYTNVSVQEAYELYNTDDSLLIIDARGCKCSYNHGHIPGAVHISDINDTSYSKIYNPNQDKDILLYNGGSWESLQIAAERFYNTTYGKIYCMIGGFTAWNTEGFPVSNRT